MRQDDHVTTAGGGAPPGEVLHRFGLVGSPERLPGGRGMAWRAGGAVLTPVEDPVAARWTADLFERLSGPGFRVPQPRRAAGGDWVAGGWAAWAHVDGEPGLVAHWPEFVGVCRAFHASLAGVEPPAWLGRDGDPWATADRVAWGERAIAVAEPLRGQVGALTAALRPVDLPAQLIHGDMGGNVLFSPTAPPAVIDFAPYLRPAGHALAIAAVDALAWSGAPPSILDHLAEEPEIDQLLARALLYRLVTESITRRDRPTLDAVARANEPVVDLVLARLAGRPAGAAYVGEADLARLVAGLLGGRPVELAPLGPGAGGHTRALRHGVNGPDGPAAFLKAAGPGGREQLLAEIDAYQAIGRAPFLPRLVAARRGRVPLLVVDLLPEDGVVRSWTAAAIAGTEALLDEVHRHPAPAGMRRLARGGGDNPWDAIGADPRRALRFGLFGERWLDDHLPTLRGAAAAARLDGDELVHLDVHLENLRRHGRRLVLVDWATAAVGNPWFDRHAWLVNLAAEGGPPPGERQGQGAAGHAAWLAGHQAVLAPSRDSAPSLFDLRRRRLAVAVAWAARLLGLPPPDGG